MATDAAQRTRDILLVVLALVAGATDATAFERLGHVFASVITGNLVVLGVSAASGNGSLGALTGSTLAGYAIGVLVATYLGGDDERVWPAGATRALGLDLVALAVFAVAWEVVGGRPSHSMQLVLVALAAIGMGAQSSAVRRMGPMSTTYLTSTLTGLVEALAKRSWSAGEARSVAIVIAAVVGAAGAVALILHTPRWLPVLQLGPLAGVLLAATRLGARQPRPRVAEGDR